MMPGPAGGTAESRARGLEFRAYNASLLHFDDLVGVPLLDESGRSLPHRDTDLDLRLACDDQP